MRRSFAPWWYAAAALALLAGCPTEDGTLDDDDSTAVDDDDSAPVDDDDAEPTCSAEAAPYTLQLSGGLNETITLDSLACSSLGGNTWRIQYEGAPGWVLRLTTGPLVSDEPITQQVAITLLDDTQQDAIYAGVVQQGHVASVTAEGYDGTPPCGTWLTDPLPNTSAAGGPAVTIETQPIPFRCP